MFEVKDNCTSELEVAIQSQHLMHLDDVIKMPPNITKLINWSNAFFSDFEYLFLQYVLIIRKINFWKTGSRVTFI